MKPTTLFLVVLVCVLFSCEPDDKMISAINSNSIQLVSADSSHCIRTYQYDELERLVSYSVGECGEGGEYFYTYEADSLIPVSRSYLSTGEHRLNQGRYYEKDSIFLVVQDDKGKRSLGTYQLDELGRVLYAYDNWRYPSRGLRYVYKNGLLISIEDKGTGAYLHLEHRFTYNDKNLLVLIEQRRSYRNIWEVKHTFKYEGDKLIRWYRDNGLTGCEYQYTGDDLTKLLVFEKRPFPIFMDTTEFVVKAKIDDDFLIRNIVKQYTHSYLELPSIIALD